MKWVYFVIQTTGATAANHPIHLHGHDFVLLDSGTGTFDLTTFSSLNFTNPPRRDVAVMPASGGFGETSGGYIVIAFPLNNPGIWVFPSIFSVNSRSCTATSHGTQVKGSRCNL